MRISDWSSDVCSSDLIVQILVIAAPSAVWLIGHHISPQQVQYRKNAEGRLLIRQRKNYFLQIGPLQFQQAVAREGGLSRLTCHAGPANAVACPLPSFTPAYAPIGRASCRERVCQYV